MDDGAGSSAHRKPMACRGGTLERCQNESVNHALVVHPPMLAVTIV
jgi:hypothetical protein